MRPLDSVRQSLRSRRAAVRRREEISAFWDERKADTSVYWTAHPLIRQHVNSLITDVPWLWPVTALKAGWVYRPLDRGISIGCGTGALERNLRMLRVCDRIDAFDVSRESIRDARKNARAEKMDGIRYRVADCDRIRLPRERYDIAFFHGSLHHISDPHRMLEEVRRSLKPHGLLYIDDYVGPSRDEWSDEHLVDARAMWETLPEELRLQPVNPPLDWQDPSEMIASSTIRPAIVERFEILEDKPYWGNLLFPLFCAIKGDEMLAPEREPIVRSMIDREMELVSQGRFQEPLFTVILGRRR